jgi:hypothetical protein
MTTRRGIFFNTKSRSVDSNVLLDDKNRSPTKSESTNIIINEDPSSSSSNSQTSPPKSTTISTGIVKKKLILKNSKRTLTKTIYSGPRKIFSTSYKVSFQNLYEFENFSFCLFQANRAQLNHKAFFGGETDEYDLDNNEATLTNLCSSQPSIQQITKTSLVVKSKSTDNIRTTTTTIMENGKTKLVCPRDQKKVN